MWPRTEDDSKPRYDQQHVYIVLFYGKNPKFVRVFDNKIMLQKYWNWYQNTKIVKQSWVP